MQKVAIIVPYFQREAAVLGRALTSVYAQNAEDVEITVLIIDDASPFDPVKDIQSAPPPPRHFTLKVLRRENGGPGAARNTGFDAAAQFADYIALLDSDDIWDPSHLKHALEALNAGADLYFSDHSNHNSQAQLQRTSFFRQLAGESKDRLLLAPQMRMYSGQLIAEFAAREYLAHTSTIVYCANKLGHLRMNETLRSAGEDHLFFVDLALASERVALSLKSEVSLGGGVSIYAGAFEWGSERDLRRRTFNLGALKMMCARRTWPEELQRRLAFRKSVMRRTIGFLLVRRILSERRFPLESLSLAWSLDKACVLLAPLNAIDFAIRRLLIGEKFLNITE